MTASMLASRVSCTDEALVKAVRAGDDGAFEELYRRYQGRIAAFVNRFVRDDGRAEDIAQEAFLSALKRMRATDSAIDFKPWIYEIARNAAIDHHRRTSRAEEVSMDADRALRPADQLRLVGPLAPESELLTKDRLDRLRRAFAELSESHERILVLRELEGLSYREIAERMDMSRPAVESTLFRARRRLEWEYAEDDAGRRCAAVRAMLARQAEGIDARGEERRAARHLRRCPGCLRAARELGVDPRPWATTVPARAAALLPMPFVFRRRRAGKVVGAEDSGGSWNLLVGSGTDLAAHAAGKAAVLIAAVALIGGGATLGGVGPLAPHSSLPPVAGNQAPGASGATSRAAEAAGPQAGARPGEAKQADPAGAGSTRGDASGQQRAGSGSQPFALPSESASELGPSGGPSALSPTRPPVHLGAPSTGAGTHSAPDLPSLPSTPSVPSDSTHLSTPKADPADAIVQGRSAAETASGLTGG